MRIRKLNKIDAALLPAALTAALLGCDTGSLTESLGTINERDISGIPGEPSGPASALRLIPRDQFGRANDATSLLYPDARADQTAQALFNPNDPGAPLNFFIVPHSDEEGIGPRFNQRRCLGCHFNSEDIRAHISVGQNISNPPATLNTANTPTSRAARQGPTIYSVVRDQNRPNTAAFTLFGDFFPGSGTFEPLSILGGPLQHVHSTSRDISCQPLPLPPREVDPNLRGGYDPVTGLSPQGAFRTIGERAGPPYIGRGLMEAIPVSELRFSWDPEDTQASASSLQPQPDVLVCPGDCISGRPNFGIAAQSMLGGDPVYRVGRFGLRGTGTTMAQFDVGGTHGEMGMTSIFAPQEVNNVANVGRDCDRQPDPEIRAQTVLDLRSLIRLIGVPDYAPELRMVSPPPGSLAAQVQEGARLFGLDLPAFLSRVTPGITPVGSTPEAEHGMAADRQLNCVGCHVPITRTGQSPARIGGEVLSNKWAPLFSDLLIHKGPSLPQGRRELLSPPLPSLPVAMQGTHVLLDPDLADYVLAFPIAGVAFGDVFRTPPLMGLGKVGPPFLHDARVFVNTIGRRIQTFTDDDRGRFGDIIRNDGGVPVSYPTPVAAAIISAQGMVNRVLEVRDMDSALNAAIELHDLPAPPDNDYAKCPQVAAERDICSRGSMHRGEARNTMERWRALPRAQQLSVIKFLESL